MIFDDLSYRTLYEIICIYFHRQNDAADAAMQSDVMILSAGYMLMIIYASFMLGKFNRLKNKVRFYYYSQLFNYLLFIHNVVLITVGGLREDAGTVDG